MVVIPTKVGIQYFPMLLDSCFRRNDKLGNEFDMTLTDYGPDLISFWGSCNLEPCQNPAGV